MNDTTQNDRTWSDAFGLVLFAVGSITGALLFKALTHTATSVEGANWAVQMGYALLWATGPVSVSMMSLSCFFLGAAQFLGYLETKRIIRHLGGVLGLSVGLSIVLGAYSPDAGGRLGMIIGGGLTDLAAAPLAALVGLAMASCSIWAAWMFPQRVTAWEKAQEIEKPAVPLQVKADGVTIEESAALAFDGEPGAFLGTVESPYPEDVRVHGQIPDGAAALGAEETSNHVEIEEESGFEEDAESAPAGAESTAETEPEGDDLMLEADQGDAGIPGEDLAVSEESTELDPADDADSEDELTGAPDATAAALEESAEGEADEEAISEGEEPEVGEHEAHEEVVGADEEEWEDELEDDESELEEGDSPDEEEDDSEYEEEDEDELEDEEELEEESGGELEEAAQFEETEAAPDPETCEVQEGQGDLFDIGGDESAETEVILEPQAKPAGTTEEVLLKAAELFLDRDRVAVSLLQRQFQLDFEESCAVLDELQERGLIGPYLGGNRRDILLSREEWLERVGGAT